MDEHDQAVSDPLSVKGQMAVRYRERQSMAFTLTGNTPLRTDATGPMLPLLSEPCNKNSSDAYTFVGQEPEPAGGRCLLNSMQDFDPSSMLARVNSMDTPSLTSTDAWQSASQEAQKVALASSVWASSLTKAETNTNMVSGSSSDCVLSRSSATVSIPLQGDSDDKLDTLRQQLTLCLSGSSPQAYSQKSPNKYTLGHMDENLNVTNSHRPTKTPDTNNAAVERAERGAGKNKGSGDKVNRTGGSLLSAPRDTTADKGEELTTAATDVAGVQRFAARETADTNQRYVVHKKDWDKRGIKRTKDPCLSASLISSHENTSHNTHNSDRATGNSRGVKSNSIPESLKERQRKGLHRPNVAAFSDQTQRMGPSQLPGRLVGSETGPNRTIDGKRTARSGDRSNQVFRSSQRSPRHQPLGDTRYSETRRSGRPPTPYRTGATSRGSSAASRPSHYNVRESWLSHYQPPDSSQTRLDREQAPEFGSARRARPLAPVNAHKDLLIDPSGGDFLSNAVISTSNSVISSVSEGAPRPHPASQIARALADRRVTRPVYITKNVATKLVHLASRAGVAKTTPKTQLRPHSASRAVELRTTNKIMPSGKQTHLRSLSEGKTPESKVLAKFHLADSSPNSEDVTSSASSHVTDSPEQPLSPEGMMKGQIWRGNFSDAGSGILTESELANNDLLPAHLANSQRILPDKSVLLSRSDESIHVRRLMPPLAHQQSDRQLDSQLPTSALIDIMTEQTCLGSTVSTMYPEESSQHRTTSWLQAKRAAANQSDSRSLSLHKKGGPGSSLGQGHQTETRTDNSANHPPNGVNHPTSNTYSLAYTDQQTKTSRPHARPSTKNATDGPDSSTSREVKSARDRHDSSRSREVKSARDRPGLPSRESTRVRHRDDSSEVRARHSPGRMSGIGDGYGTATDRRENKAHGNQYTSNRYTERPIQSPVVKQGKHSSSGYGSSPMRGEERDSRRADYPHSGKGEERDSRRADYPHSGKGEERDSRRADYPHSGKGEERDSRRADYPHSLKIRDTQQKTKPSMPEVEEMKFLTKKKTRSDTVDEISRPSRMQISPESLNSVDMYQLTDTSDWLEFPIRRGSPEECSELMGQHKKDTFLVKLPDRASPMAAVSESRQSSELQASPNLPQPDHCAISRMASSPISFVTCPDSNLPITNLSYEPNERFSFRSKIPLMYTYTAMTDRQRVDRLTRYRRWRDDMFSHHPLCQIPITKAFRRALNQAATEEWMLHSWTPHIPGYPDYAPLQTSSFHVFEEDNHAAFFSRARLVNFLAHMVYCQIGPWNCLAGMYLLMMLLGLCLVQVAIYLHNCGGQELAYFCEEDDVKCMMDTLNKNRWI